MKPTLAKSTLPVSSNDVWVTMQMHKCTRDCSPATDIGRRRRQGIGRGSASVRHRVRQGRPIVIKRTSEHGFSKSHNPAPKRRPAPHKQPYPLGGAEHKHWAETLNITPFFLKYVIALSCLCCLVYICVHS